LISKAETRVASHGNLRRVYI